MKKIIIFLFLATFSQVALSQVKIGLNVSPALGFSRVALKTDSAGYDGSGGVGLAFIGGPELSFFFGESENYSLTTGLWYTVKRAKADITVASSKYTANYNLQYLSLPLTFKLYTNEITTDMKLYFQLGGTFDIKIGGKEVGSKIKDTKAFMPVDGTVLLGAGVRYALGENTALLLGLRYTRGLVNSVNTSALDNFKILNDMVSLDLGIQF